VDEKPVKIRIKSEGGHLPGYETSGASGMDVAAMLSADVTIMPGKTALIGTGLYMEVPPGYEAQVRARSGLAAKYGVGLVNGIGTIDSDYRGEVKIILINWGEEPFTVKNGDRVAQIVICRYERAELVEVGALSETERSDGGFGHTGV